MEYLKKILLFFFYINIFSLHAHLPPITHYGGEDTIHVASEPNYPPFCSVNDAGEADGFSVDLFKETAAAVGLQVEFRVDTWNKIKQELIDGKIDALPMVGRSPERELYYDFTFPYHTLHGGVFVRKGTTGINTIEDLKSKEIIVMKGDNTEEYVLRENLSPYVISTKTYTEAFNLLQSGKHDAVIAQRLMGLQLLGLLQIEDIVPLDIDLTTFSQDFSFAVQEGNKGLLAKLNEGLSIIIANGTYDELHKKWFTPEMQRHITFKEKLKIIFKVLIPLIILISIISILILRAEVKRKTKNLNNEVVKRKEIERSIRESETWLRKIIKHNPHFIFIRDEDGIYQIVNEAMAEAYGFAPDEIEGKTDADFIKSESDIIRYKNQDLKIFNNETDRLDIEGSFIDSTGNKRFMQTIKVPFNLLTSGKKAVLGVSSDITNLRKIEAELTQKNEDLEKEINTRINAEKAFMESEITFRSIVESSPLGIHIYHLEDDDRLIFEGANPAADKLIGVDHSQYIGKTIEEAFPALVDTEIPEKYRIAARTGESWQTTQIDYHDDLVNGAFEVSAFQMHPGKVAVLFNNITDRVKAEEQLKDYRDKLELIIEERTRSLIEKTTSYEDSQLALSYLMEDVNEARIELEKVNAQFVAVNQELEAFSYSVSHDLRAPLRAIDGFSKVLEEDYFDKLDENAMECIEIIRNNAKMMGLLINDLLEFSRLSRKEIKFFEIDMNEIITDLVKEFKQNNKDRIIDFKIHDLANIKADRSMIRQVLQNLLSNAIKYSQPRKKAVIECGWTEREQDIVFFVKDNGVGFDIKYKNKLFGVFQRLHLAEEFEGTGVGLAIVQRIINKHGGNVWAEGEVDKGATFYFSIPVEKE
ncbi:transporter substrate-binding domain-containing protein [Candidatus Cloacimonadota bacterium]